MSAEAIQVVLALAGVLLTVGVSWGGAKAGARSMGHELRELRTDFKAHILKDENAELGTEKRMTRVETMVEEIHKKVKA